MRRAILTFILILTLTALSATAEGGRRLTLVGDSWIDDMLSDGETLVVVSGGSLLTWREGDDEPMIWEDAVALPQNGDETDGDWRGAWDGLRFFFDNGRLRGGRITHDADGASTGLQLCDIALGDGKATAENVVNHGMPKQLRNIAWFAARSLCVDGETLYLLGYDDARDVLCVAGPGGVSVEALPVCDCQLISAPGGPLLVLDSDDYTEKLLERVGPDGSRTPLCRLPTESRTFAADPVTGRLYCALDGRVRPVDPVAGTLGEAVAALSTEPEQATIVNGQYAAKLQRDIMLLDVSAPLDESRVLTVRGDFGEEWFDDALLSFAAERSGVTPIHVTGLPDDLLGDMLTRAADADVFLLRSDYDREFDALLSRGYALPLDGSDAVAALYGRMYPTLRDDLGRDGAPLALPLLAECEGMGVNEGLLEKLRLSLSDVPCDWAGFLDFIETALPPRLGALDDSDRFTYDMTEGAFRWYLRDALLHDWVYTANAAGRAPDYADPALVALVERVEAMDLSPFGLAEDDDPGDGFFGFGYSVSGGAAYLIQFGASYGLERPFPEGTPLPLGFGDDAPPLALKLTVAVVNPWSPRADEAVALLETLAGHIPETTLYALCPDLNAPVRRPDAEERAAMYRQYIDELSEALENGDAEDREALEGELERERRQLADFQEVGVYLISQARIDWYRAHDDIVSVALPTWFQLDGSGEANDLMNQHDAGLISAREFLEAVSRKARMQAMEGE